VYRTHVEFFPSKGPWWHSAAKTLPAQIIRVDVYDFVSRGRTGKSCECWNADGVEVEWKFDNLASQRHMVISQAWSDGWNWSRSWRRGGLMSVCILFREDCRIMCGHLVGNNLYYQRKRCPQQGHQQDTGQLRGRMDYIGPRLLPPTVGMGRY
jgi:hypothetical protein